MNRFADKRVVVTGGAQGIGLACVQRLLNEGARVLAADIKTWEESEVSKVVTMSDRFQYRQVDVTSREQVAKMVSDAVASFGGVAVLISNVGVAKKTSFLDLTDEDLSSGFQVNLVSMILCGQAVARQIKAQGTPGAIVNMSSVQSLTGFKG